MNRRLWLLLVCGWFGVVSLGGASASTRVVQAGVVSPLARQARDLGVVPDDFRLNVVVGLKLRNKAELDAWLADVSNPSSPNFQHFLSQEEFNARYGPTTAQEGAVKAWLRASGFRISRTFRNRLLVAASGDAGAAARAFAVRVHRVLFNGRRRYAILSPPTLPAGIASFTSGVTGLDNLSQLHPAAAVGSVCCHFSPLDLRTFYDDQVGLDGSGQTITIVSAKGVKDSDVQGFNGQWGLPPLAAGSGQVCVTGGNGCAVGAGYTGETLADIETAHGVAPGAVIRLYIVDQPDDSKFLVAFNRVVSDNPGHVVSYSWGLCEPDQTSSFMVTADNVFANGAAIGQTWFVASGDRGSAGDCNSKGIAQSVDFPPSSPHVTAVGGTSTVCSSGMVPATPNCRGYGSEAGWPRSGGGASAVFAEPAWQAGCNVPNDGARDVPDVALLADPRDFGYWILFTGKWFSFGGTSLAAPAWAGFFAQLNQKLGGNGLGLANPRLYQLCGRNAFHDITSGSNGLFSAVLGYDQVTGVGTIDARNLIKAY